jgi:hypothetical protein
VFIQPSSIWTQDHSGRGRADHCIIGSSGNSLTHGARRSKSRRSCSHPGNAAARIQRLIVLLSETPVWVSLATGPVAEDLPMQRRRCAWGAFRSYDCQAGQYGWHGGTDVPVGTRAARASCCCARDECGLGSGMKVHAPLQMALLGEAYGHVKDTRQGLLCIEEALARAEGTGERSCPTYRANAWLLCAALTSKPSLCTEAITLHVREAVREIPEWRPEEEPPIGIVGASTGATTPHGSGSRCRGDKSVHLAMLFGMW